MKQPPANAFDTVKAVGLQLPGVEAATKYDRSPLVLVRLSRIDREALRDLLSVSRRLTLEKTGQKSSGDRPRSELSSRSRW